MSSDDPDERYRELDSACWSIFSNEHAAAARISMLFEAYPDYALRKLRERPEFSVHCVRAICWSREMRRT